MEDPTNVSEDTVKSGSENGDIMICFAKPKCLAPSAAKDDWIQCDGCMLDFHKHCVGVLPDQDMRGTEFFCLNCSALAD